MMRVYHLEHVTDQERFAVMMAFTAGAMVEATALLWGEGGHYVHVADVQCQSLDMAYELTNNITHSWDQNELVRPSARVLEMEGARSTSMGDVIVGPDGVPQVVCGMGFSPLPFAEGTVGPRVYPAGMGER